MLNWCRHTSRNKQPSAPQPETAQSSGTEDDVTIDEITPEAVKMLLDEGHACVLLDVREPQEFRIANIAGATFIPLGQLSHRMAELDSTAEIIIYCHHGMRSLHAATLLQEAGFHHVRNMTGGIDRWSQAVDPSLSRY